jgi:hypothetical protein
MPGVFGGLAAMALVTAPLWQFVGVASTVFFSLAMGVAVGFVVSRLGRKESPYDDMDEFIVIEES